MGFQFDCNINCYKSQGFSISQAFKFHFAVSILDRKVRKYGIEKNAFFDGEKR